jgi:photosystem II stability/assembly factor-like uncharacterized protein
MWTKGLTIIAAHCAAFFWTASLYADAAGFAIPLTVIQADPHHAGTVLAGTATAQLFRSRDGGDTWTPLPFPVALRANLHALLIDPGRPDVYLAAVSSETLHLAGVFRSLDDGQTWQQLPGLENRQVWALAYWSADARVIAAGAQDGVYLTRDAGENWTRLSAAGSDGPEPVVSLAFDPTDSQVLYAGTPHLAWRTADGGATWQRIPKGMIDDSDIFAINVDESQRKRLLAAACNGIYRSVDGGSTWSSLERALGGQERTYFVVRAPRRPNLVFAGTSSGLMQSFDGGTTWFRRSAVRARSIAFDPIDPRRMFVATDRGILRSGDGGIRFR